MLWCVFKNMNHNNKHNYYYLIYKICVSKPENVVLQSLVYIYFDCISNLDLLMEMSNVIQHDLKYFLQI